MFSGLRTKRSKLPLTDCSGCSETRVQLSLSLLKIPHFPSLWNPFPTSSLLPFHQEVWWKEMATHTCISTVSNLHAGGPPSLSQRRGQFYRGDASLSLSISLTHTHTDSETHRHTAEGVARHSHPRAIQRHTQTCTKQRNNPIEPNT